ncbi:MAG: hypothetical protein PQJ46_08030 [Spirochaetales bacterium]|nr:hypothetical protein [Spirochaetales bacterium]
MTIEKLASDLCCQNHTKGSSFSQVEIEHVVASDLMSEVLVAEEENLILITALNTEQTIRTANIVDAVGIILVNGKSPQPGMLKLAKEFDLSLISTQKTMFETCAAVFQKLNT